MVIAVISILAALLLPALTRAKENGYSAVCKSNLRQYGLALSMYANDFQVFPPCYLNENNTLNPRYWHERLEPYTRTKWRTWLYWAGERPPSGIQVCPSYGRLRGMLNDSQGCYGYNNTGFMAPAGKELGLGGTDLRKQPPIGGLHNIAVDEIRFIKESQVTRPSEMIAIGDAHLMDISIIGSGPPQFLGSIELNGPELETAYELGILPEAFITPFAADKSCAWVRKRHLGRWNVIFCDGHVENRKTAELFDPRQEKVAQRWNRDNQPHKENLHWW